MVITRSGKNTKQKKFSHSYHSLIALIRRLGAVKWETTGEEDKSADFVYLTAYFDPDLGFAIRLTNGDIIELEPIKGKVDKVDLKFRVSRAGPLYKTEIYLPIVKWTKLDTYGVEPICGAELRLLII